MREYGFLLTKNGSVKTPYSPIFYAVNNTSDATNSKTDITDASASLQVILPPLHLTLLLSQVTRTFKEQRQYIFKLLLFVYIHTSNP